jgi:hypothetical protein
MNLWIIAVSVGITILSLVKIFAKLAEAEANNKIRMINNDASYFSSLGLSEEEWRKKMKALWPKDFK